MKKVIVASTNPVKIAVAELAFSAVFPNEPFEIIGVSVDSGVPDQPFGDETRRGAENRLKAIIERHPDVHFYMSQEGGLYDDADMMYNRAWIFVADNEGRIGHSSTPSFVIPTKIAEYVRGGLELGHATDKYYGTSNIKQKGGGISLMTDGILDRKNYYLQSAIIALCQVKNHHLYKE